MRHEFEPDSTELADVDDSRRPLLHPAIWALANLGAIAVMWGYLVVRTGTPPDVEVVLMCILMAPAFAAGAIDGRLRALATLNLTIWILIAVAVLGWTGTEAFRRDCGLGTAFGFLFAAIAAFAYPFMSGAAFAIGKLTRGAKPV